jgi:hypothetical protein
MLLLSGVRARTDARREVRGSCMGKRDALLFIGSEASLLAQALRDLPAEGVKGQRQPVAPEVPPEIELRQDQVLVEAGTESLVDDLRDKALRQPSSPGLLVLALDRVFSTGEGTLSILTFGLGLAKIPNTAIKSFLYDGKVSERYPLELRQGEDVCRQCVAARDVALVEQRIAHVSPHGQLVTEDRRVPRTCLGSLGRHEAVTPSNCFVCAAETVHVAELSIDVQ